MHQLIVAPEISALPSVPAIINEGAVIKRQFLDNATGILAVDNAMTRDSASDLAGRIAGHIAQVEKDRKAIKDPFFRMGQAIDAAAAAHVKELEAEKIRLNRLVGAFNQEQADKAQREQEARDREARRIQQEAAEAQRKADAEAERLRKEQEALALKQKQAQEAAEAKGREQTPAAKARALQAQLDAGEAAEAAEAKRKEQQEASDRALRQLESERLAAEEKLRSEKPSGGAQRTEPKITVTDVHALYAYQRNLVRMEPDLVNLKFLIRGNPTISIPGVSFVMESTFSAKAR